MSLSLASSPLVQSTFKSTKRDSSKRAPSSEKRRNSATSRPDFPGFELPADGDAPSQTPGTTAVSWAPPADNAFPVVGYVRDQSCGDGFGDPRPGGRTHEGVDCFSKDSHAPLVAVEDATIRVVRTAAETPEYSGNSISIRGDSGWRYYYGHIESTPFRKADEGVTRVRKGDVIALMGSTGTSVEHLHFEAAPGDAAAVDPYPFMATWQRTDGNGAPPPAPESPPDTPPPPPVDGCGVLVPGQVMVPGQVLYSCDERFQLQLQTDGNIVPPPGWLPAIADLARRHGALLIVDEMICGWGCGAIKKRRPRWRLRARLRRRDCATWPMCRTATARMAAKPRSPVLKVKWKVENPDGDDTTYTLEARREGEANWRPIQTGKSPLTATSWDWNTETYPDGWYRVRVTASDAAANSPDRALTQSQLSTTFAIDNTRPLIDGLTVSYPRAQARASDALSPIGELAFSIDDGPWQLGAAADGVFDDLAEDLRLELPTGLARGTHTLALRVADAAGNVGSASTTFLIK